jgi:bifunctional non-homologous end joining protein LigD
MADRLERYREMRDFSNTPEPRGQGRAATSGRLHYYIQRHNARRLHYDFRLELEGVLKSWAVPKGPSLDPKDKRLAVQTEDHPLEYGEFEGVIPPKQYGAGDVLLWDKGGWTPEDDDPAEALRKGRLHFHLDGEKLAGRWVLVKKDEKNWFLIKRRDQAASSGDITQQRPDSVKKRKAKGARQGVPAFAAPMLATLVTEPPRGGDWLYEVKYDGYRMLARLSNGEARLFTRAANDWTKKLPQLASGLASLGLDDTWLDGEIVVQDAKGRSDFQALQNAFDARRDANILYYVFDAPFLEGRDLRQHSLRARKKRLEQSLKGTTHIRYNSHLEGDAKAVMDEACRMELEGLIGKEARSTYVSGRSRSWIKLKCRRRQDFVIGGYTAPKGARQGFGALLVGYHDGGNLKYAGKVGTGFDEQLLSKLKKRFSVLEIENPRFQDPPREKNVTWLKPSLVAEVNYAERTNEGILRQASFVGLREDLPAQQVGEEKPVKPIKITHPDRLIWPKLGVRKVDLVHYIEEVGEAMLPHLIRRPLSLVRCPDGAEGQCFYQRHPAAGLKLPSVKGSRYVYLETVDQITAAVQYGAIEFHTWGATVPDAKHPDRFTLDLDPDPSLSWAKLRDATQITRALLTELKLKSFLKTTGGKGLHIVVPIEPQLGWDEVKEFTRRIALFLQKAEPALFLANMSKAKRTGKVFVDYLRNGETASAVAAFSPRARPEAGVSTPLAWDELGRADPRGRHTVKTVPARLKRLRVDPWEEYSSAKQRITEAMRRSLG